MWVFLRKNLWLCWAFANKTPLEKTNGTDRQPWITASNKHGSFQYRKHNLECLWHNSKRSLPVSAGRGVQTENISNRQTAFKCPWQETHDPEHMHALREIRLQKRCGIHPLWWTLHGEIHSSCLRLHRFENYLCLVIFLNWPLSLLQQNKLRPWRHVVSPKVNTSKVKTGSNK